MRMVTSTRFEIDTVEVLKNQAWPLETSQARIQVIDNVCGVCFYRKDSEVSLGLIH